MQAIEALQVAANLAFGQRGGLKAAAQWKTSQISAASMFHVEH